MPDDARQVNATEGISARAAVDYLPRLVNHAAKVGADNSFNQAAGVGLVIKINPAGVGLIQALGTRGIACSNRYHRHRHS